MTGQTLEDGYAIRSGDGRAGVDFAFGDCGAGVAMKMPLLDIDESNLWREVKDGYVAAAMLYARHYSAHQYKDGRRQRYGYRNRFLICGPGEKMLLMTPHDDALFVWRKFIDDSGQVGVNCAVFRNESQWLSSALIFQAVIRAWKKWPNERLYTYIDQQAIKGTNPGYCYLQAGWVRLKERTKSRGLRIMELVPNDDLAGTS